MIHCLKILKRTSSYKLCTSTTYRANFTAYSMPQKSFQQNNRQHALHIDDTFAGRATMRQKESAMNNFHGTIENNNFEILGLKIQTENDRTSNLYGRITLKQTELIEVNR